LVRRAPLGSLRPSADRTVKNGKRRLKLNRIGPLKNAKQELRPFGDRSVELGLRLYFQQRFMGGGSMAEGRRQRAMEIAEIAGIADIARDRQSKPYS